MPEKLPAYVKLIKEHCGVPVAWIGTGPEPRRHDQSPDSDHYLTQVLIRYVETMNLEC